MFNFINNYFLYIKSIHIIAIISWMAGILYLPRLYVYHSEVKDNQQQSNTFKIMEKKLLFYIIKPALLISIITGFLMAHYVYNIKDTWLHVKMLFVLLLILYTIFLTISCKKFEKDINNISSKKWRILNEIPTILMIIIVLLTVVKPI